MMLEAETSRKLENAEAKMKMICFIFMIDSMFSSLHLVFWSSSALFGHEYHGSELLDGPTFVGQVEQSRMNHFFLHAKVTK